ncbi:MAG: peptidoglycan DD-metalloendopeptidase family protein [Gammaproteobacteria bacterium]|nr:peptidoglycan DD-metalloendopeptidase family protein [Gammaproteobacteria bacterium]
MDNGVERIALPLALPHLIQPAGEPHSPSASELQPWQTVMVKSGDTLSHIFSRIGLGGRPLQEVLALGQDIAPLALLRPGQQIQFRIDNGKQLRELRFDVYENSLHIQRVGTALQATSISHELETRPVYATGTIESSLFQAADQAGISDNLTFAMADMFGWDIDFAQDLRVGDKFTVIYDEHYVAGEKIRDGNILAAEFTNRGTTYRAIRFDDGSDQVNYYTPEGLSMRKAFLRSPVKFSRISSGFTLARYHPVLHRMRAHKGVDYAAPTGTPIRAASNGKVIFRGVKGGYGNTIILQHAGSYTTLYAHMSSFARGLKQGARVQQGELIGYVGKSGMATGPHLHYEFRIAGVHRNPLTVPLPKAEPIMAKYKPAFKAEAHRLIAQMELFKTGNQIALNAR